MILLAILGVLLLGYMVILITHSNKPNTARSWVIAMTAAGLAWLASFALRLYLPSDVALLEWFPGTAFQDSLGLRLDYINWPYMVAVLTICLASLLTHTTRTGSGVNTFSWTQILITTALNLIAILAANPLTMAIAWMLTDLVELFSTLRLAQETETGSKVVNLFSIRLLSTLVLMVATAFAWRNEPFSGFEIMQPRGSLFFLIAAGLRLGVLPLNLPLLDSPELRRGVGTLARLIPAASALVLIAHLPAELLVFNQNMVGVIQIITLIAALYSSAMWFTRKDVYEAKPYWMVALSSFAIQSALNGQAEASRVWGLALLLSGSLLFLFDPPIRRIRYLPALGLLGIVGLPYTLAASGWDGILPQSFNYVSVIMILTHALLVLGYIRYILGADSTVTGLEKHARITFPLGLVTLIQTILILGIVGWPGVLVTGNLWASLISLAVVIIGVLIGWRLNFRMDSESLGQKIPFYRLFKTVLDFFRKVLSLSWLSDLGKKLAKSLAGLFGFFSLILEGDGGIMWSLVFIVLFGILFLSLTRL